LKFIALAFLHTKSSIWSVIPSFFMAASPGIRVTLRSSLSSADASDPANSILQKIQAIRQGVNQLREDNLEYERVRDQYIIHLQQCQDDHNILRQIFNKLRLKLDLAAQESQPAPEAVTSHAPAAAPLTRRIPTLETVRLTPVVTSNSDLFPSTSIRLRYAVSTSSVVCTAQFSPNGTRIAFADGNYVYIMQSSDGEVLANIELPGNAESGTAHTRSLKWSPNNKLVALTGPANDVLLYDADTRRLVHTFEGHQKEVSSIVFSADGTWLISGGFDGLIFVWDVRSHANVKRLQHGKSGNDGTIVEIATTPDVPFYAVGFMNGTIGIYSDRFEEPMMSFSAHSQILMGLSVSPFDETIATVSQDRSVKVWIMRGVASCRHTLEGHTDFVLSVAFSSKAAIMVTGSKDQMLKMWQHKTGKLLCTVQAHRNTLFEIDHHPMERAFVSCSGDGVVCVWDYDELA
jgi:WD40 repeat protein